VAANRIELRIGINLGGVTLQGIEELVRYSN
jgi:hypothetical protein